MKRKMKFCILYGSKKSKKICDTYAEQEKRIRVIHQKNQGVSSARNAGLDASAGKYITFADADDWIDTTLFQKCFDVLSENPADVLKDKGGLDSCTFRDYLSYIWFIILPETLVEGKGLFLEEYGIQFIDKILAEGSRMEFLSQNDSRKKLIKIS